MENGKYDTTTKKMEKFLLNYVVPDLQSGT